MDFFGILLLTFLGLITLIYLCKCFFRREEYIVDDEITPEDFQFLQQHIDNINNVAINYNPNPRLYNNNIISRNNTTPEIETPPKYEDIQNEPPNYPSSNSS